MAYKPSFQGKDEMELHPFPGKDDMGFRDKDDMGFRDKDDMEVDYKLLLICVVATVLILVLLAVLLLFCLKNKWWQSLSRKFSASSLCGSVQENELSVWHGYGDGQASPLGYPAPNTISGAEQFTYTNEAATCQTYTYSGSVSGEASDRTLASCPRVSSVDFCDRRGVPDDFLYELRKQEDTSNIKTIHGKLVVCVSRWVDHRGAVLILDCMGISLTIPPGALATTRRELISLSLVWDLNDGPKLTEKQGLVSPVVHCGPHGLTLKRPCTLTYKHCAFEPTVVSTWTSETHLFDDKKWRILSKKRDADRRWSYVGDECVVKLSHFSLYSSVMTAEDGGVVKKWIQMVPFAYALRDGRFYEVRIYLLNNTPCALQFARYKEGELGGRQCNAEKLLLFEGDGSNLKLELTTLCDGWTNIDAPKEDVQFVQLWHNLCPYASFCFQRDDPTVADISVTMVAYQRSRLEDSAKLRILASTEESQATRSSDAQNSLPPSSITPPSENHLNSNKGGTPLLGLPGPRVPRIPHPLRMKLQMLLDARSTLGNDWRAFAAKINLDHCIRWLETQPSPMAILLDRFEEEGRTMEDLACILYHMERLDAAATVMDQLKEVDTRRGSHDTTVSCRDVTMATAMEHLKEEDTRRGSDKTTVSCRDVTMATALDHLKEVDTHRGSDDITTCRDATMATAMEVDQCPGLDNTNNIDGNVTMGTARVTNHLKEIELCNGADDTINTSSGVNMATVSGPDNTATSEGTVGMATEDESDLSTDL